MFNNKVDNQAYIGLDLPISRANVDGTGFMLNVRAKYTAKNGGAVISTANTNLDGTGTLSSAMITGASNGTLIHAVTVKALSNTTHGMVRLFAYNSGTFLLIEEIPITPVTKSATDASFEVRQIIDFNLKSGWVLYSSTEKAETFWVGLECLEWTYPA